MKKLIAAILCTTTLILLCSCSSANKNSNISDTAPTDDISTSTNDFTTSLTEVPTEPTISEIDYDIRLAGGSDPNSNDTIWLLAKEYEDYSGTRIEVAVTKGDEIIVDFTSDSPFVENGGLFYDKQSVADIERCKKNNQNPFQYIGNGCFAYKNFIIYNCFNQTSINLREAEADYLYKDFYANLDYGSHSYIHDRDNIVLVEDNYSGVYILNTETMQLKQADFEMYSICAYGDGLFAGKEDMLSVYNFYDINGTKVLSLDKYGSFINSTDWISSYGKYETVPVFSEGKCTFYTKNDQNSIYKVTIDKQGNVLESEKIK